MCKYKSAKVLTTVSSQQTVYCPASRSAWVRLGVRLGTCHLVCLTAQLAPWRLVSQQKWKHHAVKSLTAWCLAVLLDACLHTRPCSPSASARDPHLKQLWATQTEHPRQSATASSENLNLQELEEIGIARSQSVTLCGAHAARNRVICHYFYALRFTEPDGYCYCYCYYY